MRRGIHVLHGQSWTAASIAVGTEMPTPSPGGLNRDPGRLTRAIWRCERALCSELQTTNRQSIPSSALLERRWKRPTCTCALQPRMYIRWHGQRPGERKVRRNPAGEPHLERGGGAECYLLPWALFFRRPTFKENEDKRTGRRARKGDAVALPWFISIRGCKAW